MNYSFKCVNGTVSENLIRTYKSKSVRKTLAKVAAIYGLAMLLCFFALFKREVDIRSYLSFSFGFLSLSAGSFLILSLVLLIKIFLSKKMVFRLVGGQIYLDKEQVVVSHFKDFFALYREGFCLEIVNKDNYFKSFFIYGDNLILEEVIKTLKNNSVVVKDYLTNEVL